MQKTYDLWLPYFKQGDDLSSCIRVVNETEGRGDNNHDPSVLGTNGSIEALLMDADNLSAAVERLREVAVVLTKYNGVISNADVHYITITCDKEVEQDPIVGKILQLCEWENKEDWEDDEVEINNELG